MRCEEYEPNIVAHALGELPAGVAASCEAHIRGCAQCRKAYEAYLSLAKAAVAPLEPGPTGQELESMSSALDSFVAAGWPEPAASIQRVGLSWWSLLTGRAMKVSFAACALAAVGLAIWQLSPQHPSRHNHRPQLQSFVALPIKRDTKIGHALPVKSRPTAMAQRPDLKPVVAAVPRQASSHRALKARRHRVYMAVTTPVQVPEPQQPPSTSIPPDTAYQAGRLLGQGLTTLADNARPETFAKISTAIKGIVFHAKSKSKGESNEKSNSSDPVDRVNGDAGPSSPVYIEACSQTGISDGSGA